MSGWPTAALEEVADIERNVVEASAIQDGTPYVGLENIASGGEFVDLRSVEQGELASSKFSFSPRHVLFGKLRPYLAKIARPEFSGVCSTDILPILPRPSLDRDYLSHFLLRPESVAWASSRAAGANLPRLSPRVLAGMRLPLPPLPEQRRIAEVLDRAEALRAKRRAALAQLDTLTQSIFLEMFGDPLGNPRNWPLVRFEDLCNRVTVGIVVQPASYYVSEGIPALRSLNVRAGSIDLESLVYFSERDNATKLAKTRLKTGDLVLVRSGQPGTASVVPPDLDGVNAIDLLIATPKGEIADSTFLCAFFNSSGGRDLVLSRQRGQVQKHLNVGSLNEARLPLPPLRMQREYARRVACGGELRKSVLSSVRELDSLFGSLQYRAFRGEL